MKQGNRKKWRQKRYNFLFCEWETSTMKSYYNKYSFNFENTNEKKVEKVEEKKSFSFLLPSHSVLSELLYHISDFYQFAM